MSDLPTVLARCPVFHDMNLEERGEIVDLLEPASYPAGETILREGKSIQCLWIVSRGTCRVVKAMKGGEQELAVLEPGAVFGEMSFFHPAPHSASVRTVTEVEVLRLWREQFDALERAAPHAAYRIVHNTARVLAQRLRQMDEWVGGLIESPDGARHREEWREFRAKLYSDWAF